MNRIRLKCTSMVLTNPQRLAGLSSTRVISTSSPVNQGSKSAESSGIKIPAYVPRGPTDILRALSQTVGVDHTAAHFKYHDDPYLIPTSNNNKRIFALAAESGRKAAKWIKQEHADLFQVPPIKVINVHLLIYPIPFQHSIAEPPIKAFSADNIFTEQTDVTETLLQNLIQQNEITDSITVFLLLEKNGTEVSAETKQHLLELVCFYNGDNTTSEEWIEERWFKQSMTPRERNRKTWKDHDLAERLFQGMEVKGSAAYDAIIRGMCKYYQAEKAWHLFETAQKEQVPLHVETYNAMILATNFLAERDAKWEKLNGLLKTMNDNQITPNLITLNNSLATVSSTMNRQVRSWALSLLAEFRRFPHIQPSLATWYFMLVIFCRDNGPTSHILVNILDEIEGQSFTIRDPRDVFFFVTAMDVCSNHLQDKDVANRVNDLVHTGENYNLIGDSFKESIYYRHYFNLLCRSEPLDVFMETYHKYVPNIYIPEPSIMENILKQIELEAAVEQLPLIWSHMVIFDQTNREPLVNLILRIMTENKTESVELQEKFSAIAGEMWQKMEDIQENPNHMGTVVNWTGPMLGQILKLTARAGNYEHAQKVFLKLDKDQHNILGVADRLAIEEFITLSVQNKEPSQAIRALQYCVENGHDGCAELAGIITGGLNLDSVHQSKIQSLVKN